MSEMSKPKLKELAAVPREEITAKHLAKITKLGKEDRKRLVEYAAAQQPPNEAMIAIGGILSYEEFRRGGKDRLDPTVAPNKDSKTAEAAFPATDMSGLIRSHRKQYTPPVTGGALSE